MGAAVHYEMKWKRPPVIEETDRDVIAESTERAGPFFLLPQYPEVAKRVVASWSWAPFCVHRNLIRLRQPDLRERVAAPTPVIAGEQGRSVPVSSAELLAERIPGARPHVVSDAGHFMFLEHPAEVASAIRAFVSGPPGKAFVAKEKSMAERRTGEVRPDSVWQSPHRNTLAVLTGCVVLVWAVMMSVFPALPHVAAELRLESSSLGALLAVSSLVMAVLNVPAGLLSDQYGRKPPIAVGLGVSAVGIFLAAVSSAGPALLIAGWLVFGVGRGLFLSPTSTVLADLFSLQRRGKPIGVLAGGIGVGSVLGYVLGGLLSAGGNWQLVLWVDGALLAVATVAAALLPESLKEKLPSTLPKAFARFGNRAVVVSGVVAGVAFAVGVALPLAGVSVVSVAIICAFVGLAEGLAISMTTAMVTGEVLKPDPRRVGSALGANRLIQGIGAILGPVFGGLLVRGVGIGARFWVLAGAGAVAVVLALALRGAPVRAVAA
ncbi:MFS transporter [Amycolatopsis sp. NPDC004079]|uniref:MFS transporter n=1 Tax=Amycolatopsis sp. NPDC004079 TaxID=3154549 RepID=UPI00339E496E